MPEPWRILHVLDHLGAGGIQTYALNLFRHWKDERFKHEIAALHGPGVNHDRFISLGMTPRYAAANRRSLSLPWELRRIVQAARPDLVHVYGVPACLLVESLRGWLGAPLVVTHLQSTYADHPGQRYQDYLERLCYRRTDHIVACSHAVTEGLHRRAPMTIIPNGIDVERFGIASGRDALRSGMGISGDDFVVGSNGRLVVGKDPWTLLRAFERVAREDARARLLWVGGGPLQEELQAWLSGRGLLERTHWTGFVSPDEVPGLLHAMDLFVFPSLREGSPLALAEAMAAGLPCVCADFPAAKETLDDGVTGMITPRGDDAAMAGHMLRLMEDAPLRERLADHARRQARARFSAQTMASHVAEVYFRLLNNT